jgi:hypothetical protein
LGSLPIGSCCIYKDANGMTGHKFSLALNYAIL